MLHDLLDILNGFLVDTICVYFLSFQVRSFWQQDGTSQYTISQWIDIFVMILLSFFFYMPLSFVPVVSHLYFSFSFRPFFSISLCPPAYLCVPLPLAHGNPLHLRPPTVSPLYISPLSSPHAFLPLAPVPFSWLKPFPWPISFSLFN